MEHEYITTKKELPEGVYYPKFLQYEIFLSASAKQQYIFLLEKTLREERSDQMSLAGCIRRYQSRIRRFI